MLVILKRNFFTDLGRFRSTGKTPVEIPDSLAGKLPRDAVVIERPKSKRRGGRPPKEQGQTEEKSGDPEE